MGASGALPASVADWVAAEAARGLLAPSTYDAFRSRVETMKQSLLTLLGGLTGAGKRVVGYGASARANTLLNYFGIGNSTLEYIVDRNRLKHGLYSPGMHIPVHSVDRLQEDDPDYVLILAWNFAEEITRQLAWYRRRGGRFILPIPEPQVIA